MGNERERERESIENDESHSIIGTSKQQHKCCVVPQHILLLYHKTIKEFGTTKLILLHNFSTETTNTIKKLPFLKFIQYVLPTQLNSIGVLQGDNMKRWYNPWLAHNV